MLWDAGSGERARVATAHAAVLARLAESLPAAWSVSLLEPSRPERRAFRTADVVSRKQWDLRRRRQPRHAVIVCSGHDSALGAHDAQSLLASCRLLVVLARPAERPAELGARRLASRQLGEFELALYRGDFTDPLLRVDDYPTGVRPLRSDLDSLHRVLSRIDRARIAFHLGIVPALLDAPMVRFLNGLEHLIVAQHGFDHGYPTYSRLLLERNDPFNQRGTVGAFDEFAGQSYADQLDRLTRGRDLLEAHLGRKVKSYVPPTNTGNRRTGRALEALGFEYVLSEKAIPGSSLPLLPSGFYGRSTELPRGALPDVLTLHATWEADILEQGDDSLTGFLAALLAEGQRRRDEVERVVERVVSRVGGN
jgi:hypothetical protein